MSRLSNLEKLCIPHCSQLNFTITSLPSTLKEIDIRGINVENIQLRKSGTSKTDQDMSFGASLQQIEVVNPVTCKCPQTVTRMFGAPLGEGVTCGLTDTIFSATNVFANKGSLYGYQDFSAGFTSDGIGSAISSCEYLVADPFLKFLIWVMTALAISGNITSLFYRLFMDRKRFGIYPLISRCQIY